LKNIILLLLLIISLFLNACAPKKAMLKVDTLIASGEYKRAAEFSDSQIDKEDFYDIDNLLWYLNSGSSYAYADDSISSIKSFDNSEHLMKHFREQLLANDISQTLKSTLLNDTTRPYKGTEYDGIMVNTYKAIEYMSKDDMSGARVEFNRAIDRQRRAKIFFNKMIQKEKDAIKQEEKERAKKGENFTISDSTLTNTLNSHYPNLHSFEAYPDFVNPMTTYLAAIFAQSQNDTSKAQTLLKESFFMMKDNEDVKADFEGKRDKQMVWIIFENGQAPILKEFRVDFPMWIFSNNLSYISVALPKLIERSSAFSYLNISVNDNNIKTKYLCSMENIIKTEFTKSYEATVRRAILSAATKAAISYTANKKSKNTDGELLVNLVSALYQIASTRADTRIWSTLPKEFQLARFSRPSDGKITIYTPNNRLVKELHLPNKNNILIYVKIATSNTLASVKVIPFGNDKYTRKIK